MKRVVKKFGGTSVGSIERIRHVASLIAEFRRSNPDTEVAVVVSAMAGETNRLIALAKSLTEKPEPRELDVMVSTGEQITIALLSMALIEQGFPAQSLDGQQAQISTNRSFMNAHITGIDASKMEAILSTGKIPVVAGFQGVDEDGNVTTLGRGGSDITAVAIAAALNADACYIYTDVDGVYTADPRVVRGARFLDRVCHEEMLEMASLGAKVLHPRSVYFAMCYKVPLVVLSTFTPGPGTWIVREEQLMEKPVVTGITHRTDEGKVVIERLTGGVSALNKLFNRLAQESVFVDMITQSETDGGMNSLSFTVPLESAERALEIARECAGDSKGEKVRLQKDIAKVSVVGIGMRYHSGVAAKVFKALASEQIAVDMISTSEIKISVVVPQRYWEVAVRVLHEAFLEMEPQISEER